MSATPMRAQTVFISGNSLSSRRSTSSSRLMVSLSALPGRKNVCMAMSPSSSSGMNSPPIRLNVSPVSKSRPKAAISTPFLWRREKASIGWYTLLYIHSISRALPLSRAISIRARRLLDIFAGIMSREDITGTYVRQRMMAPISAKEKV